MVFQVLNGSSYVSCAQSVVKVFRNKSHFHDCDCDGEIAQEVMSKTKWEVLGMKKKSNRCVYLIDSETKIKKTNFDHNLGSIK